MTHTTIPTRDMKRWTDLQIKAAIHALFEDQSGDVDFTAYEESTGVLYRAHSAMTAHLLAVERLYRQFGLVEVESRDCERFPVSGVFIQGIEGYAIYRGDLYRLLNIARLSRINGALRCALFASGGDA